MAIVQRWWVLGVICAAGLALRWPSPDRQLEYDEVVSLLFARMDLGTMVQATAADTMPPLYYALLHFWQLPGESLFHARLLSVILGVLTIPLLYLLGKRLLDEGTALAGAALLALSPFHVFYSHYARMYALLTLLSVLAVLALIGWLRGGSRKGLVIAVLSTIAALYVHNLAALLVLTLNLLFLLTRNRWPEQGAPRPLRDLMIVDVVLALAWLPWLSVLPGQLDKIAAAFWIQHPGAAEVARSAIVYHFHLPLPDLWLPVAAFLALLLVAITAAEVRRVWLEEPPRRAGLLALITLALAPPGFMFLLSQAQPVYVERGILLSALAYYLLLALALRRLPLRPLAWGLTVVFGLALGAAHVYQVSYEAFPRSPFAQAAAYLGGVVQPGDLVLHDNKLSYFPTYYLAPELPQAFLADPPGSPNDTLAPGTQQALGLYPVALPDGVEGRSRVWLVAFDQALQEGRAAGQPLASKAWLDDRYTRTDQAQVGDLRLYLYTLEH